MSKVVIKDKSKLQAYKDILEKEFVAFCEERSLLITNRPEGVELYEIVRHIKQKVSQYNSDKCKMEAMLDGSVDLVTMDALEYQKILKVVQDCEGEEE